MTSQARWRPAAARPSLKAASRQRPDQHACCSTTPAATSASTISTHGASASRMARSPTTCRRGPDLRRQPVGHHRSRRAMPADRAAGTAARASHRSRCRRARTAGARGDRAQRASSRQRGELAPVHRRASARPQPDYDHMTPEVAAWTRQQLPFNQAILAQARAAAGAVVPGVSPDRQRHLHGPLRQRHGGMADRARPQRHDRAHRARPAILTVSSSVRRRSAPARPIGACDSRR